MRCKTVTNNRSYSDANRQGNSFVHEQMRLENSLPTTARNIISSIRCVLKTYLSDFFNKCFIIQTHFLRFLLATAISGVKSQRSVASILTCLTKDEKKNPVQLPIILSQSNIGLRHSEDCLQLVCVITTEKKSSPFFTNNRPDFPNSFYVNIPVGICAIQKTNCRSLTKTVTQRIC